MAIPVYRAHAVTSPGNHNGSTTGNKPTNTADNDILVASLYIESDTAVTAPSGWTLKDGPMECNDSGGAFRQYVYWKRASSEGASWSWTYTGNQFTAILVVAYSGAVTSGDPFNITTSGVRDNNLSTASPILSMTTTVANTKLVWLDEAYQGGVGSGLTGFTERFDGAAETVYLADKDMASAGATGSLNESRTGTNGTMTAWMGAVKEAAASAASLLGAKSSRNKMPLALLNR